MAMVRRLGKAPSIDLQPGLLASQAGSKGTGLRAVRTGMGLLVFGGRYGHAAACTAISSLCRIDWKFSCQAAQPMTVENASAPLAVCRLPPPGS